MQPDLKLKIGGDTVGSVLQKGVLQSLFVATFGSQHNAYYVSTRILYQLEL
jgi:hypothetical protein